jgi:hypothetical protein
VNGLDWLVGAGLRIECWLPFWGFGRFLRQSGYGQIDTEAGRGISMSKKDDWLDSDWDDAPDHIRERMRGLKKRRSFTVLGFLQVIALAGLVVLAVQLSKHYGPQQSISPKVAAPAATPERYSIPQKLEPIKITSTALRPSAPKPLDKCMKSGNVVDEDVVRCRYGALPRSDNSPAPSQGMVSAEYLESFRNQSSRTATQPQRSASSIERDAQWVDKWSGGGRYLAEWLIRDNRIDGTSVCANHKRGSIDYRECRKGAKQFYKEQCRAWEARSEQDRHDHSKRMEQRYCSAANGFNPMG